MDREGFWGILQARRGSYLRAYLLWIAYFLLCAVLDGWWYAEPANPPFWKLSLDIADSMFAPVALGIPASIFMVEVAWDGLKILKKKGESLMGLVFKNFENKWVIKGREEGREEEYARITEYLKEQAREQGVEYTPPPPPEDMSKK